MKATQVDVLYSYSPIRFTELELGVRTSELAAPRDKIFRPQITPSHRRTLTQQVSGSVL